MALDALPTQRTEALRNHLVHLTLEDSSVNLVSIGVNAYSTQSGHPCSFSARYWLIPTSACPLLQRFAIEDGGRGSEPSPRIALSALPDTWLVLSAGEDGSSGIPRSTSHDPGV